MYPQGYVCILTYIVYCLENDLQSLRRPIPLISGKLG